jgi:hypothetical protein
MYNQYNQIVYTDMLKRREYFLFDISQKIVFFIFRCNNTTNLPLDN